MRVLGLDPSLTNFGWALHDTETHRGTAARLLARGRFQTPAKMEFIDRYVSQRERLVELIKLHQPDRVGLEFPVFDQMFSEGMYGLFLFVSEALKTSRCDVVFWSPLQIKAHARDSLVDSEGNPARPKGWKMDKVDMVEAAGMDTGISRWNHNEADAYLAAVLAGRFWKLFDGTLSEADLTPTEARYFLEVKEFLRGKMAGKTVKKGVMFRENDRFFSWSHRQESL